MFLFQEHLPKKKKNFEKAFDRVVWDYCLLMLCVCVCGFFFPYSTWSKSTYSFRYQKLRATLWSELRLKIFLDIHTVIIVTTGRVRQMAGHYFFMILPPVLAVSLYKMGKSPVTISPSSNWGFTTMVAVSIYLEMNLISYFLYCCLKII